MRARTTKCCNEMCGWVGACKRINHTHGKDEACADHNMRVSTLMLSIAASSAWQLTPSMSLHRSAGQPSRLGGLDLQMNSVIEELDESNFLQTINAHDGMSVVEFYAPWCRTCRGVAPTFERMCLRLSGEPEYAQLKFFKVNFKENKQLALRERVFALPAVHFYTPALGRINRFTLSPANVAKKLRSEADRYVGESGHLALLTTLKKKPSAISPLVRFSMLAAFLQALVNADQYLEKADNEDGAFLANMMEGDPRRVKELEDLFGACVCATTVRAVPKCHPDVQLPPCRSRVPPSHGNESQRHPPLPWPPPRSLASCSQPGWTPTTTATLTPTSSRQWRRRSDPWVVDLACRRGRGRGARGSMTST